MIEKIEISQIQKQFWILQNLYPNNCAYNIPSVFKIEGSPDIEALQKAIAQILFRHEVLRVRFYEEDGTVFQELIPDDQIDLKIGIISLNESLQPLFLPVQVMNEVNRPFDLRIWPLMRANIYLLPNNLSVFSIVFHHIIVDLYSLQVFANELSELYKLYSSGSSTLIKDTPDNFKNYSTFLENMLSSELGKKKVSDWMKDMPNKPEMLELPTDFSKSKVNVLNGKRMHFIMDSRMTFKISEFAQSNSINNFTVLLAAYALFMNRLSNQSKIVIGVPFANRKSMIFRDTFGCFVNILPIQINFANSLTGDGLVMDVFQALLQAHRKQEVPFLLLNSKLGKNEGTALFQVGFTFEQPMILKLIGAEVTPLVVERDGTQLDLFLTLWEDHHRYNAYLQYSSDCFRKETIEHFWNIYCTVINSLIDNSHFFVSDINITPKEDLQIINELNMTEASYDENLCIHQKFEMQVERSPSDPAIMYDNKILNYRDLNTNAIRMANALIDAGVGIEDIVGICVDRSVEMMIGIFGILKAGAAYMPLNPATPTERLNSIILDSNPKIILTNKYSSQNIPEGCRLIYLDDILVNPISEKTIDPKIKVNSNNLAYIIYTSGSTGKPKGVMIEHHSVLNRLGWMQKVYPIDKNDTLLQKTPITFDVSVWELFWWSFYGSKLVLLPKGGEKDPETIVNIINIYHITIIHFVPSMFTVFFEFIKAKNKLEKLQCLKYLFMSGEVLPLKLVKEINEYRVDYNLPEIINLYGPTEATVDVSYYNCPNSDVKNIYIGKPIDNTNLFVLSNRDIIQPIGVNGELIITGVNLARGYKNNPELTDLKFFNFKVKDNKIVKAYRTGDLVRLTSEKEIDYIGRLDNQVKIRGFRIELGDIESKILEHPGISNCAVIVLENNEQKSLIAYISFKPGSKISEELIRKYLSGKLPDYMIPTYYVYLENLPLTTSGKLSRKDLPFPILERDKNEIVPPRNETERKLVDLWKTLLRVENISTSDNFFDIGGNSLLAISLFAKIEYIFNVNLILRVFFDSPRIKDLAEAIDSASHKTIEQNYDKNTSKFKRNIVKGEI